MIDSFKIFTQQVAKSFQDIAKHPRVFVIGLDGDALYAIYLASFPDGTNPMCKKRTEHDCSCCKSFIRHAGNVGTIDDEGLIHTVWDDAAKNAPYPYNVVAQAIVNALNDKGIVDLFCVGRSQASFGVPENRSQDEVTKGITVWRHFHTGEIPEELRSPTPGKKQGDYRTTAQVFERGLKELSPSAVDTALELIDNGLYRGLEHRTAVIEFQKAQRQYLELPERGRNDFAWRNAHGPASRFRGLVIGSLVQDLSEGVEIEEAAHRFGSKMDPTRYKRSSSVITPGMVKAAMKTITDLGLEPALERRFARIDDVSVNDVLWVDGTVKPLMKGGIGDLLLQHATTARNTEEDENRAEDITIDDFIQRILPETTGLQILFKSEHLGNLMSLTAPVHNDPKRLFRWDNDFAWSYGGNVADSIKERVKKAGGNVTNAKLRVSLSWYNFDDLDLHVFEPGAYQGSPGHIFFRNMRGAGGGHLDVDMNAGAGHTREAVENVSWVTLRDGEYRVAVNNYHLRETSDVGFVVETESKGKISNFTYSKAVRNQETVAVATLHVKGGVIDRFEVNNPGITTTAVTQEKWGLETEQYVKVNAVTLSPNFWGENKVGNKHTFFVIEGAKNDEPTRGLYNEFLHSRLEPHRKVFEVIGDKTKCQPTDGQLSGLGFSSTKPDTVIMKVSQGKKQRLFKVYVGI